MRLKLIACKVLFRELSWLSAMSDNIIDITWIRQGYHHYPEHLRELLQQEINAIESNEDEYTNPLIVTGEGGGVPDDYDAILLGYGLCSNAVTGVTSKKYRLVIPKAHDCITLFLGSKERYKTCFDSLPGCFWYTSGWIENTDMPGEERMGRLRNYYAEEMEYDEETIDYLIEELHGLKNYHAAAYVNMPAFDRAHYRDITKKAAAFFGWDFHELDGDMGLLKKMISGDWNSNDFLVLEPGEAAGQSYDAEVIRAVRS